MNKYQLNFVVFLGLASACVAHANLREHLNRPKDINIETRPEHPQNDNNINFHPHSISLRRRLTSEMATKSDNKPSKRSFSTLPVPPSPPSLTFPDGNFYKIGTLSNMIHIWVDPVRGSDTRTGATRITALKTLAAAWNKIPKGQELTKGYYIHITKGSLTPAMQPNYWESRYGTASAPIIIEGADAGRVARLASVNIYDCKFLYFINVSFDQNPEDMVHCEQCTALLLRNVTVKGKRGNTWEAVKLNQCTGVYVEDCDISGADDNAIDVFAVRYGHILRSKIYNANWCIYHKGGSSHHLVAQNEIYNCGESGYAAGQGGGLEYMVAPWLRYESYDIRVINNAIHDVWGAGLGVYGSQHVLMAHNTLYKVGSRSHAVEFLLGGRQCDGDTDTCVVKNSEGGWGGTDGNTCGIPSSGVYFLNNIIMNPAPYQTQWQHITVANPEDSLPGSNVPGPLVFADNGLVIKGNIFWNGGPDMSLGVEDWSEGCAAANPTCNRAQILADNVFNTINPGLTSPTSKPTASALSGYTKLVSPIPSWASWDGALGEPAGPTANAVLYDRSGILRAGRNAPGAYAF